MFANNQRELYRQLNCSKSDDLQRDFDEENIKLFWEQLWLSGVNHNKDAAWISALKQLFATSVHQQAEFAITSESVSQTIKKFANWKAPGSDVIHAVWLKHLPGLRTAKNCYPAPAGFYGGHPSWMATGRTILLNQKDPFLLILGQSLVCL